MEKTYITHYYYPGTDPWKNIMNLPEEEAFRLAGELADAHPETMSFYRFADFVNYHPLRKNADARVRARFTELGGKPELAHPYCFVLGESERVTVFFSQERTQDPVDVSAVSFADRSDRRVHGGVIGDPVRIHYLVKTDAQSRAAFRIEFFRRTARKIRGEGVEGDLSLEYAVNEAGVKAAVGFRHSGRLSRRVDLEI